MERRTIGSLDVSVVAVGCSDFGTSVDDRRVDEIVGAALETGINYFDTSDNYGDGRSEESLGKALVGRRDQVVVTTKYEDRPETVHDHAESALRRLDTDYIDLFLLHHIEPLGLPLGDTVDALNSLVEEGKIREFGFTTMTLDEIREVRALGESSTHFACVQNDYNLLSRTVELDVLPECATTGLGFTAFFPLYRGLLTGKFKRGERPNKDTRLGGRDSARRQARVLTDAHFDVVEALATFAKERGHSVLDVALARLLAQPGVSTVLPGAWSAEEVRENAAAGSWRPSAEEIAEIDRLAPCDPQAEGTPSGRRERLEDLRSKAP